MATGTGRKTSARKNTSTKKTSKKKQQEQTFFRNEVILWIMLAVCIVLFIANFGIGGFIGGKLSTFFFGVFGVMAYIFPICLFVGTAFSISNKENKIAVIKIIAAILFVAFLCLFVQMITDTEKNMEILDSFLYSEKTRGGGGIVGGLLENLLCPNVGVIGTYVIDIIVLIISMILITERSAFRGMQKGGQVIYDSAKENHIQRKEERAIVKEQKRIDKKVSGVALDTKILLPVNDFSECSDEINEITLDNFPDMPVIQEENHVKLTATNSPTAADIQNTIVVDKVSEIVIAEPNLVSKKRSSKQSQQEIASNVNEIEQAMVSDAGDAEKQYVFPPIELLKKGNANASGDSKKHLQDTADKLQLTLKNFGINIRVTEINCGPAVTRYEFQPEMGVKVSKIVNLADDIKLNLAAADIRIEAPIPGKAAIGIEIPNKESIPVMFRDLIESADFKQHPSHIAFVAGKDISGKVIVTDIAKMPHLLIAGATGSGKSVCINTIIMSILYHAKPDDVKLIMIDPKVVELSVYNGIPHLFIPVVTDPKKAAGALHWAVAEMSDRYQKFAEYGVRDLKGYNKKIDGIKGVNDSEKPQKMPQIVIIVDELADLMMAAPGDVEDAICRLAQLARACGIHLIIATQRPSVNVITGLIKANMPSRIAFSVTSGVDSRTILDMNGAEKLLGKGDMLFYPQGFQKPLRVQGAFVSDKEVADVVDFLKNQHGEVTYSEEIEAKLNNISGTSNSSEGSGSCSGDERDVYFVDAAKLLIDKDKGSIGMLQRYFKVGFNRAARIMDQLEEAGVVGSDEGTKPRQVLMSPEQLDEFIEDYV